jgi:DNA-directed RNA polymerase subunit RPC12/RpoP
LDPQILDGLFGADRPTFSNLPQWFEIGGRCSRCHRDGWLDRWELARRFGNGQYIHQLEHRLRCTACGHRGTNRWIVVKVPR